MQVFPVQFNPVKKTLRVYSHLRVRVSFAGGEQFITDDRLRSPAFDQVLDRLLLNSRTAELTTGLEEAAYSDGNSLLIITHPDFLSAANTLAAWKIKKGIYTEVRTTTQTGTTAAAIQAYIQNAYDNWSTPPTYILLIGDAEFVPCHYVTNHPYNFYFVCNGCQGDVGTDLYYTTVDGSDYFPDIYLGRLSVDTLAEANKRVNDIINYERIPVTTDSFYQNAAICAEFQDRDPQDNYADRRFAQTSEDVALYLSGSSYLDKYTVDRIYFADPAVTPTHWGN